LERLARDKCSILFGLVTSNEEKSFKICGKIIKLFSSSLMLLVNKLEHWSLEEIYSLVYYLPVRPGAYPRLGASEKVSA
jgi:hypothetical protein